MAKIISTNIESRTISEYYPFFKITLIGIFIGSIYWLVAKFVEMFVIEPLFCGQTTGSLICIDSIGVSGDIATILIATIGLIMMVYLRMYYPLIIAMATGFILWGLSRWTDGLPIAEIILCDVILYAVSYNLFSWITRYFRITPIIMTTIFVIGVARVILSL